MNISFYPAADGFLWFIFDNESVTRAKDFKSKREAENWLTARRLRA